MLGLPVSVVTPRRRGKASKIDRTSRGSRTGGFSPRRDAGAFLEGRTTARLVEGAPPWEWHVQGLPDGQDVGTQLAGVAPSMTRRMRAEATITPSAWAAASTACAGVEMPNPIRTGLVVSSRSRAATDPADSASAPRSPVVPMTVMP